MESTPEGATRHRIGRLYRWLFFVFGLGAVVLGAVLVAKLVSDPPSGRYGAVVIAALAILAALMAGAGLWFAGVAVMADRYTVLLSASGVRVGEERWILWSEIGSVRDRFGMQRLDLLDHQGQRLASVEYQVEDAPHVIAEIRNRVRRPAVLQPAAHPRRFGSRKEALAVAVLLNVLISGFFLSMWYASRSFWFLVAAAIHLVIMNLEGRKDVVQLDIKDDELVIWWTLKKQAVRREEIAAVELSQEYVGATMVGKCVLRLHDGTRRFLASIGADQESIHRAIEAWLERR